MTASPRVRRDGLPYRTKADRAKAADPRTELEEYKRLVRQEAFRVQKEQGYCDDGLNRTLRTLGLPPKVKVAVPIAYTVTHKRMVYVEGYDVVDEESARAFIQSDAGKQWMKDKILGTTVNVDEVRIVEIPSSDEVTEGDFDPTGAERVAVAGPGEGAERRGCNRYNTMGYTCTRPAGHTGQHVAGNGETVRSVWQPKSEQDKYDYNARWEFWGYRPGEPDYDRWYAIRAARTTSWLRSNALDSEWWYPLPLEEVEKLAGITPPVAPEPLRSV